MCYLAKVSLPLNVIIILLNVLFSDLKATLCSEDEVFRETFSKLVFEKLFCAKLQDVVQFLFGHGSSLGAQTRSHHQVSQHHLFLCHLKHKGHEMTFASAGVLLFSFFNIVLYLPGF